jgi:hypothetical protein
MNRRKPRQVLECASRLLWQWRRANQKRQRTGAVQDATARSEGSWSQCMRKSEWRFSLKERVKVRGNVTKYNPAYRATHGTGVEADY